MEVFFIKNMINIIKKLFRPKPKLSKEAFIAYFNRLPEEIEVKWFRDGKFIIGRVRAENKEFMTQGLSTEDFIKMVNESIYTVYNIPEDYIDTLSEFRYYNPPIEEKKKLGDLRVHNSHINIIKEKKLQVA